MVTRQELANELIASDAQITTALTTASGSVAAAATALGIKRWLLSAIMHVRKLRRP